MQSPEEILNNWLNAVNNGDIENLLALYNEKAVLIPTFSNRILNSPDKIRDYFTQLGNREELSVALHQKTVHTQNISDSIIAICAIYCWRFAVEDELLSFEARFSYLIDVDLTKPILQHHSSQIPRVI